MPVTDPAKLQIVHQRVINKKICRKCGAINPPKAEKCRKCKSRNLRLKKGFRTKYK
ncbi:MAG: 50S ribosomal protein L40e [Desulfurococcaceae archaeon]